ncbi:MAG: sigma-70 family RNA polymerase sigma factor [Candidatus Aureabacteria bacterium]|nr:sigma-70 family RNA polymerase sigma factor [Candidatus Auribacterota bacterium]
MYAVAGRHSRNAQEMRELFMYVIEQLWANGARRLAAWEARAKLSSYLASVASHVCIDYYKSRAHREQYRYRPLDVTEQPPRDGNKPSGYTKRPFPSPIENERAALLNGVMEQLPEDERAILTLFYWQGFRYAEIASLTGMTAGKVGKSLFRSRERLRSLLAGRGIKNIGDLLE